MKEFLELQGYILEDRPEYFRFNELESQHYSKKLNEKSKLVVTLLKEECFLVRVFEGGEKAGSVKTLFKGIIK